MFSFATRQLFHELLRTTFFVESLFENLREHLSRRENEYQDLNLADLFGLIDQDKDSKVSRFELRTFL